MSKSSLEEGSSRSKEIFIRFFMVGPRDMKEIIGI